MIFGNKRLLLNYILVAALVIFCSACYQDVIDLDLSNIDRQIVIVGKINEGNTTNYIDITHTGSLNISQAFDPVSDAEVTVSDDRGNNVTFAEQSPGKYRSTSINGTQGTTYIINVNSGGKTYSAISRMPYALEIDTIYFYQVSQYSQSYLMTLSFTDRAGTPDYGMIKIYVNNILREVHFYKDTYTDGEKIVLDQFKEYFYRGNDIKIEFYALDVPAYRYYSMLFNEDQILSEDNNDEIDYSDLIFSPNFNPTNNFTNNALGFFSAQVIRTYRPVVE